MAQKKKPLTEDDLFAGSTMTFGEHLEELRLTLWRSIVGLVGGFLIGLALANPIVKFIQGPLTDALQRYYLDLAKDEVKKKHGGQFAPEELVLIEEEGLTPDRLFLSTQNAIETLKEQYPNELALLALKPHRYTEADIAPGRAARLWQRWGEAREKPATPAGVVYGLLTEAERRRADAAAKEPAAETPADRAALAAALDRLAEQRELLDAQPLKDISFPDKDTGKAVAQWREELAADFDTDTLRRLNRVLLATAFPGELRRPRAGVMTIASWRPISIKVQALGAHEAFMIWLRASFIAGMLIASPWIFWQIWHFVAAGLYPHEQRYVYIYLPMSLILFIGGAALAFFFVFQPVLDFLFSFNKALGIDPDPRISEWLSFVLMLPLGFGISFQLPMVMLFLQRIGIFTTEQYLSQWRMAILVIFVVSMFLTPADPISMLLMAGPLTLLYFGGVGLCRWMPRGRNPFDEVYEP